MKKIITILAIVFLAAGTAYAGNSQRATVKFRIKTEFRATPDSSSIVTISISDAEGKIVYSEIRTDNENIDILKLHLKKKLPKGTYLLTLESDNQKITQKLVVE